ncbi:branched-chain amino acid ABC transporter substrate-binding protein [Motiliproteus sp. SC1-56]|uniref:branched-chain amino acid ABC transporter substrate-binding protein n=1 Tax=Motiliproteus sp. SC1-56 TaxID=2799565 RepID=UPI001A8DF7D4|nr:branched-chain amino acid ABC transporter substrate-binding protein [Motiliproteus sp. SC1-56]
MISKQFKRLAVSAAVAASLSAGIASAETIKIGVAGPHTGAYANFGVQLWQGATLAAEKINSNGGIDGKQIELVKGDDACEPKQALAVANRMVEVDGVAGVVGHFCSSSTLPASEIYEDAGVVMVTPGSTNPAVTDRGLSVVLRNTGRDDQQGIVAAEYIVNDLNAKRVAVIHDKDTYGQGLADAMKAHLNKIGTKEVLYEGLTRGEKDFNALVTKIKAADADVIYFGGLHSEAGPLVRQLREQGVDGTFFSGDGIVSEDLMPAAGGGKNVDGIMMTFGRDPRTFDEGKQVVAEFRAKGFEPEGYTLYAYSTVQAIAQGIDGADTTDGEKVAEWLKAHSAKTIMGERKWDAKGDLTRSDYAVYRWNQDGSYAKAN